MKVQSKSVDAFHALVTLSLFAKVQSVSHVFIHIKRLKAHCFYVFDNGFVRWMRPRNTSLLLGTLADFAKGRNGLLVENALFRLPLIVLSRQIKRPACRKTDRFLLALLARMIRTWKQALFIVQPET
jgi:putative transposase